MGFDVESHLRAVERSVSSLERDGQPARAITLVRSYATTVEDVWDAVTNGERIPRWFLSVSGLLELGGRYQLEGDGKRLKPWRAKSLSRASASRMPWRRMSSKLVQSTSESSRWLAVNSAATAAA